MDVGLNQSLGDSVACGPWTSPINIITNTLIRPFIFSLGSLEEGSLSISCSQLISSVMSARTRLHLKLHLTTLSMLDFCASPSYVMHTRWLAQLPPPHPHPHTAWKEGAPPAWVCGPHFLVRLGNFFPRASGRLPLHPVSQNCIASLPPAAQGLDSRETSR